MIDLAENLAQVHRRVQISINSGPAHAVTPTLIAVSKTRDAAEIAALQGLGVDNFGENYVDEAVAKIQALRELAICWHYIGAIQANKTAQLAAHFDWVQSVDRFKIARRLSEQRPAALGPLNICVQVNISEEPQKAGVAVADVAALAADITTLPNLRLRGLMAIPQHAGDERRQADFAAMFNVFTQLQQQMNGTGGTIDTLSMGMSADIEFAVQAGATMLRVGEALFGPRG